MTIINTILLSGWFQLILLATIFFIYSSRVIKQRSLRGYALGWMLGLFFIMTYVSIARPTALQLGAYDSTLNVAQIIIAGLSGIFISTGITISAHIFRNNRIQQALHTAAITAILVVSTFLQLIAGSEIRLMVSLFILAFGMASLTASIVMSRRDGVVEANIAPDYTGYDVPVEQRQRSRLDIIRSRFKNRVNRNNAPSNVHDYPVQEQ